jgi:hypothetical protein
MRLKLFPERFKIFETDPCPPLISNVRKSGFDFGQIATAGENFSNQAADSVSHLKAINIDDVLARMQIAQLDIGADNVFLQGGQLARLAKGVVTKLSKLEIGAGH